MNCGECQQPITCGCQKIKASNGLDVHKGCLISYEKKINPNEATLMNTVRPKENKRIVIPPTTVRS